MVLTIDARGVNYAKILAALVLNLGQARLCALPDLLRASRASYLCSGLVGQAVVVAITHRFGQVGCWLPGCFFDRMAEPLYEIFAVRGGSSACEQLLHHEGSVRARVLFARTSS